LFYRAFCIFAGAMGEHRHLKFFKKQEIADVTPILGEDMLRLKISLLDNGDTRIIARCGTSKRQLSMTTDLAVPVQHDTPVMLGGSGTAVRIRSIKVRQQPRLDDVMEYSYATSACGNCCNLQ
jgi:hypothetical protein